MPSLPWVVTVSTNASSSSSSFVQRWASLFSLAFFVSSVAFVLSFQKKKKRKRKKNPTKDERKREGEIDLKNAKKSQKVHSRTFCFSSLHF